MHGAPSRVNVDISELKSSSMLRRIGGVSGLFVLLTFGWYLVFPFVTGCDMNTTAVETQECEELITPVLSFFCALPPLMIAVLVFVSTHGKKSKVLLENPVVDEEGKCNSRPPSNRLRRASSKRNSHSPAWDSVPC